MECLRMNQDDYERALDGDMNLSNTDLKGAIFTGAKGL